MSDDLPFIRHLVEAGNDELMDELGPILTTIHSLDSTHPDLGPLIQQARAMLSPEFSIQDAELVLRALWAATDYCLSRPERNPE